MIYQNLPEHLLLTKLGESDSAAFQEIYRRYKQYVFAIVAARTESEDDAKDIIQDIFVSLWNNRDRIAGVNNLKTYIFALSKNHIISVYRKHHVRLNGELYLIEQVTQIQHSPEQYRLASELSETISAAVNQLPETMRHCYHLSRNEGKKNGEIADMLNLSEKTVRNNVSEA